MSALPAAEEGGEEANIALCERAFWRAARKSKMCGFEWNEGIGTEAQQSMGISSRLAIGTTTERLWRGVVVV